MPHVEHGQPCPKCGQKLKKFAWHSKCHFCGASFEDDAKTPATPPSPPPVGSKQYLVISQTDEWFMGKFNPMKLQDRLNQLGAEGWSISAATTSDVGTWFGSFGGGMRQEMVVLMEREVTEAIVAKFVAGAVEVAAELEKQHPCPQCDRPGELTSTPGVYSCGTHTWR
jgi:ribosomal protein L37AE/L43A